MRSERVICETCDKLCIERFYKNLLKSGAHANNNRKRQQPFVNRWSDCL